MFSCSEIWCLRFKCHLVSSCVIQEFHFQKCTRKSKPRGRGGRVLGPRHRRTQHRPPALRTCQEVPAHLQRAWPGEKGKDVHTKIVTHTANIAANNWLWQAIFPVQKAFLLLALFCPLRKKVKPSLTEKGRNWGLKGEDGYLREKEVNCFRQWRTGWDERLELR